VAEPHDARTLIARHVTALEQITGSDRHAAIGTDLGGFITAADGLEDASDLAGLDLPSAVAAGNALRLISATFARRTPMAAAPA
jgi:hypothetical protein